MKLNIFSFGWQKCFIRRCGGNIDRWFATGIWITRKWTNSSQCSTPAQQPQSFWGVRHYWWIRTGKTGWKTCWARFVDCSTRQNLNLTGLTLTTSVIVVSIDTFTAFICFLLFSTFSDVEKKTGNEISADHAYRILSWRQSLASSCDRDASIQVWDDQVLHLVHCEDFLISFVSSHTETIRNFMLETREAVSIVGQSAILQVCTLS